MLFRSAPEAGDRAASDLPVDPADAKIDFLGARDLAPQPGRPVQVRSVLDADLLTWIAARALAPGEPATPRPYVARELHLFLTTSNLRGVPYRLKVENAELGMTGHGDRFHYRFDGLGTADAPSRWAGSDPSIPLDRGDLQIGRAHV